jgi:hypothetical protein
MTVMAVELLGAAMLPHVALVAVFAWLLSGHRSIYSSQRAARGKHAGELLPGLPLLHEMDQPHPAAALKKASPRKRPHGKA